MTTLHEIYEEEQRMRKLKSLVDLVAQQLRVGNFDTEHAQQLIEETKRKVLELFPDKEFQFELIYRPRFNRILQEKKIADRKDYKPTANNG
ncbi:MAG: hypothetical protein N3A72_10145 [bacterium]|nr:hypothetical protein [bacterium]